MNMNLSVSAPRILVIGSSNMDLMARMEHVPRAGETVVGARYEYTAGGKGANAALTVAALGGDSVFAARLGDDVNGKKLRQYYEIHGVDTRFLITDYDNKTGLALVMVEESGQNRIIVYPGSNMALTPQDAEDALVCRPDALLMQFEMPAEVVLAATKIANRHGTPVVIDAGPGVKTFPLEQLGEIEVFSPNETETQCYTGIEPRGEQSCLKACMALKKRVNARYIVLKLGDRGAFIYDGTRCSFKSSIDVEAVDTTAAGDIFTAAMTLELMRSRNIQRAVEYGNIAAALSVTRAGASVSIPTYEQVAAFIKEKEIPFLLK